MIINLEYIKTDAGQVWAKQHLDDVVRILSDGRYWLQSQTGYTDSQSEAGCWPLADALKISGLVKTKAIITYELN